MPTLLPWLWIVWLLPAAPQRQPSEPAQQPVSRVRMAARVVDAGGQPVDGARVSFVTLSAWIEEAPLTDLRDFLDHDLASLCHRRGQQRLTDSTGVARASFDGGALALAETDGRSGLQLFGFDESHDYDHEEVLTIELRLRRLRSSRPLRAPGDDPPHAGDAERGGDRSTDESLPVHAPTMARRAVAGIPSADREPASGFVKQPASIRRSVPVEPEGCLMTSLEEAGSDGITVP